MILRVLVGQIGLGTVPTRGLSRFCPTAKWFGFGWDKRRMDLSQAASSVPLGRPRPFAPLSTHRQGASRSRGGPFSTAGLSVSAARKAGVPFSAILAFRAALCLRQFTSRSGPSPGYSTLGEEQLHSGRNVPLAGFPARYALSLHAQCGGKFGLRQLRGLPSPA